MSSTFTAFTIAIFIGGVPVNDPSDRIGPFPDATACYEFRNKIDVSIKDAFDTQTVFGISSDRWNIGGGAIYRYVDYELACVREVHDSETGGLVDEMFFW